MAARTLAMIALCLAAAPCRAQFAPPSAEAGAKARADLASILQPEAVFESGGGDGTHIEGRMYTRPAATDFPDLCRRDLVAVGYAGVGPGGSYAERAQEPFAVRAETQYRALGGRVTIPPRFPTGHLTFGGACATVDAASPAGWFTARSSFAAAYGYNALAVALATLREGKRRIPGCHDKKGAISAACGFFAATKLPGEVHAVVECASKTPDPCYGFGLANGYFVTIRFDYRPSPRDSVLRSIEIDENNEIMVN